MLKITIPSTELYDETKDEFLSTKETSIQLEHSLISVSKWESRWCKPFLTKNSKTTEETIDYIKCMTISQNVDPLVYSLISSKIVEDVISYIEAPMTATTFSKDDKKVSNNEIITSEIIYYWMITLNIPFECEKWHLNRLLTLINVCSIKNRPQKKFSKRELLDRNRSLNAARREMLNTSG